MKCESMGRLYKAGEVENRVNVLCDKHANKQYERFLEEQLFGVMGIVSRTRDEVYTTDVLIP